MTEDELENNLGTIAKSGSLAFKTENEQSEDVDIIGQFGVGFYSAFMVAKKVTVITKAYGSDVAYRWESVGVDGYTISEDDKASVGTEIILELLDDTDDEKYGEFLDTYRLKGLVTKYSDYIRFPIKMEVTHSRPVELSEEDKLTVNRARKVQRFLSQPFAVAEQFTGVPGVMVSIEDTIRGFKMIMDGEVDDIPEQAFLNVGTIEEAIKKGEDMLKAL